MGMCVWCMYVFVCGCGGISTHSASLPIPTVPQEVSVIVETDDGGKFPVKLLDCDTVTQAKEKIIDAAFRSVKASQRYTLQEVDLQFRTEDSTPRLLRDEDKTSLVEGAWRKINTLKHYRVSHMTVT